MYDIVCCIWLYVADLRINTSEHQYTIDHLPPDTYIVWVTAWTEQGEGPPGETIKFIIQRKTLLLLYSQLLSICFLAVRFVLH